MKEIITKVISFSGDQHTTGWRTFNTDIPITATIIGVYLRKSPNEQTERYLIDNINILNTSSSNYILGVRVLTVIGTWHIYISYIL